VPERTLTLTLTNGSLTEARAWLTPVPGLLIAERPLGGWVIACESARTSIAKFADPEAALACAIEIGPLARWESETYDGIRSIRGQRELYALIKAIVSRWGGGGPGSKGQS
jgi:hypothetical protein